jgi:hypothetical protein
VASSLGRELHPFELSCRQPRNDLVNSWLMAQAVCATLEAAVVRAVGKLLALADQVIE